LSAVADSKGVRAQRKVITFNSVPRSIIFELIYQKNYRKSTRPKSLDLICSIYNTFPTFLSREIELVSGMSVANPGERSQNGKNETQNGVILRMKEKNRDAEKR